jgi:glycine cleavage system transcriptional repressor
MSQDAYLVMSALGPDRVGLVAEVTDYITAGGGNVEDSRMAVMGGEFGILVLVSASAAEVEALERNVKALEAKTGLSFQTRRTAAPSENRRADLIPCLVTADALDHEGIVLAVTRALHAAGVNIVSLETTAYEAPINGSPLFRMEARVDVPPGITVAKLRRSMEAVAEAENLDIEVRTLVGRG